MVCVEDDEVGTLDSTEGVAIDGGLDAPRDVDDVDIAVRAGREK